MFETILKFFGLLFLLYIAAAVLPIVAVGIIFYSLWKLCTKK